MSPQDEKLANELFDDIEPISEYEAGSEPQVTADGYDYWVLLANFQDVADMGTKTPQPGFFMAPGPSCTFTMH